MSEWRSERGRRRGGRTTTEASSCPPAPRGPGKHMAKCRDKLIVSRNDMSPMPTIKMEARSRCSDPQGVHCNNAPSPSAPQRSTMNPRETYQAFPMPSAPWGAGSLLKALLGRLRRPERTDRAGAGARGCAGVCDQGVRCGLHDFSAPRALNPCISISLVRPVH